MLTQNASGRRDKRQTRKMPERIKRILSDREATRKNTSGKADGYHVRVQGDKIPDTGE